MKDIIKEVEQLLDNMREPGFILTRALVNEAKRQQAEIEKKDIEIDILIRKKEALKDEVEQWKEEANKYQNLWCEAMKGEQAIKDGEKKEYITSLSALNVLLEANENATKKLRAEIERLRHEYSNAVLSIKSKQTYIDCLKEYAKERKTEEIENRGIEKFARRLKAEVAHIPAWGSVAERKIDNLVKEMVGDDNATN